MLKEDKTFKILTITSIFCALSELILTFVFKVGNQHDRSLFEAMELVFLVSLDI